MRRLVVRAQLVLALTLAHSAAFAQGAGSAGAAPAAGGGGAAAPAEAPAPAPAPPAGGTAPSLADSTARPNARATPGGYAYGDKAPARGKAVHGVKPRGTGPVATFPGFQSLDGGGSRVFVQLSSPVPVEERKAQGSFTYVLKGAHVKLRNNTNALVTVHFDTPVSRARLVPAGKDLHLVIDLRVAATPTFAVKEGPEKSSMLVVDFPKGDYLPKSQEPGPGAPGEPGDEPAPSKPARPAQPAQPAGGAGPNP